MKKTAKAVLSFILTAIIVFSSIAVIGVSAADDCDCGHTPMVMVSGFGATTLIKINDDGSISYRYYTACEGLVEEVSKPGLITKDEWSNIHIKLIRKSADLPNECDDFYKAGKMQIYIYVNGYLKLVSKELPELILKSLDDTPERQEGVPYNISIGGGTQGLSERILLDYYDRTDYILPLEEHFGGSFIGDIKNFTFVPCTMDFPTIFQKRNGF
jgi:hypothetical protein